MCLAFVGTVGRPVGSLDLNTLAIIADLKDKKQSYSTEEDNNLSGLTQSFPLSSPMVEMGSLRSSHCCWIIIPIGLSQWVGIIGVVVPEGWEVSEMSRPGLNPGCCVNALEFAYTHET